MALLLDQRGFDLVDCFDAIVPLIYEELRRLAAFHLRRERPGHMYGPAELISELYLRLRTTSALELADRAHLFAIASRNMQQILVDDARRRGAVRRGAGDETVELDETAVDTERPVELVALHDALDELARRDARKAQVLALHYFGGLTHAEIAAVCDIHTNTVFRDLRTGEAWLRDQLRACD